MQDLGEPRSYLSVDKGIPVFSSDGERLGRVVEVLSAPNLDMFDGIIFDTTAGPGGHRFVDAPEVDEIFERGVVLKIDAAAARQLPKPGKNPGSIEVSDEDLTEKDPTLMERAWNFLSGKGNS
ncbi:MAG: PRC-barrel domain-containing protein [Solirubrobacterales bacterium]